MKKQIALLTVLALVFTILAGMTPVYAAEEQPAMIYVATDGSDSADGSFEYPVATFEKARDIARVAGGKAVVNIRGGIYEVNDTLTLTEQDSGLTFRSYMDEEVVISGASKVDASAFKKVTDEAVLNRVVDKSARDKILSADLKSLGITEYGRIKNQGRGTMPDPGFSTALYVDDQMQTLARYPNEGYINIDEVIEQGSVPRNDENLKPEDFKGFKIRTNDKRLDNWKDAEEIWVFGYFMHDWAEADFNVTIDFDDKNTILSDWPSFYGVTKDRRMYFFNLLEELDAPGEWYLDRTNGILYLYPSQTLGGDTKVELVTNDQTFITIEGAKDISIKGIHFEKSLGQGIIANGVENLLIADCEFSYIMDTVISITGTKCSVVSNHIHDVGSRAVFMEGGDRNTLTSGENVITNNIIERFQQVKPTGAYGIEARGVGTLISHNVVRECNSIAILYFGNNHILEYNDVSKACMDTSDQGAIYSGRSWASRGNVIRYNYIHDMSMIDTNTGMTIQGVYLDDMHSSTEVYGNVFYNLVAVTLYGGGRNNTFQNNIMIDCKEPFRMDSRGLTWMDSGKDSEIRRNLDAVPYQNEVWSAAYPELVNILEDEPQIPKYNVISGNVSFNTPDYEVTEEVVKYGTMENNITIKDKNNFVDYKNQNFTLREDSEVYTKLPDFEPIPFDKIGTYEDRIGQIGKDSVMLYIGSPRAVAKGTQTLVDLQNQKVQPVVKDGRTLVPVRFIAESFGAKVDWEENTQTVTVEQGGQTVILQIGSDRMDVDGTGVTLDVPAQTIEERTMVPLRAIVEALGKQVFWDDKGLIVVSESEGMITREDTFLIDELIRSLTIY